MIKRILLTFLLLLSSLPALAVRWYEIEVILFEQASEERLAAETWDEQPKLADLSKLQDIITQPTYLQDIRNLCYKGNYYQVKSLPALEEIIETDESEVTVNTILPNDTLPVTSPESMSDELTELDIEEPFQLLDNSEHELKDVYAQLRRRRGYRMLFHEAWRQPMQSRREAIPMRFYAGADYGEKFNYAGELLEPPEETDVEELNTDFVEVTQESLLPEPEYQNPFKRFFLREPVADLMNVDRFFRLTTQQRAREQLQQCSAVLTDIKALEKPKVWQVDGSIKFYAERFRHIETNLSLRIPGTEEISLEAEAIEAAVTEATDMEQQEIDPTNPVGSLTPDEWDLDDSLLTNEEEKLTEIREILAHYSMQQRRRITDEKIHYFDHPLFGLLVQMRVYDPEEAARENQL